MKQPLLFLGHGNPINVLGGNAYSDKWDELGKDIDMDGVKAVVVVSAHWMTSGTHITDAPKQPIIYDFYGFPEEMYNIKYDANGDPEMAKILQKQMMEYEAKLDSSWGLDHGTWTVLKHLLPEPKIPVLQISIDMTKSLSDLYDVFASLKPLRYRGVLFMGSGNIVHNLREMDFMNNKPFDWALEFDDLSKKIIENQDKSLLINPFKSGLAARHAIPADDHYRPLVAMMALMDKNEQPEFFNEVIDLGSVSMRSFRTRGRG